MPTTPMASAIGMRINASSIMAHKPIRASLMSGRGLGRAAFAGREGLVDVHQAGEGDHRGHEIDERADRILITSVVSPYPLMRPALIHICQVRKNMIAAHSTCTARTCC